MAPRVPSASSATTPTASTPGGSRSCATSARRGPPPMGPDKNAKPGHQAANKESPMAHNSSMQRSHAALARTLAAALSIFALACSGDVINVGDDAMEPTTDGACPAPGNIVIMNQAELDALEGCRSEE